MQRFDEEAARCSVIADVLAGLSRVPFRDVAPSMSTDELAQLIADAGFEIRRRTLPDDDLPHFGGGDTQ